MNIPMGSTTFQNYLTSGIPGLFMPKWQNPVNSASGYYDQIPDILKQYVGPYSQAGSNMIPVLQGEYGNLTSNPGGFLNQIGQNFQQSPGFNFSVQQAIKAANNAAAAGGMAGSPAEQQQLAGTVTGLANQDYYNWLNQAGNLFSQGLQGQQNMFNTGSQSSEALAQALSQALMNQGNLAYQGTELQNAQNEGWLGALGGLLGNL